MDPSMNTEPESKTNQLVITSPLLLSLLLSYIYKFFEFFAIIIINIELE
jgi:hypothetical protein